MVIKDCDLTVPIMLTLAVAHVLPPAFVAMQMYCAL